MQGQRLDGTDTEGEGVNICVIIGTRGRPRQCGAVIELLRAMASGLHQIQYVVSCDGDDSRTLDFFAAGWDDITQCIARRTIGLGKVWNRCIDHYEANIYMLIADDSFIACENWDEAMSWAIVQPNVAELGVFTMPDSANPGQATLFGVNKTWLDLTEKPVLDERFPFWFADTAIQETYKFITGRGLPCVQALKQITPAGKYNPGIRDLELWWDLFRATRKERKATAAMVRAKLGLPLPEIDQIEAGFLRMEATGRAAIPGIMSKIENPRPPTPEYLECKANAEAYLRDHA